MGRPGCEGGTVCWSDYPTVHTMYWVASDTPGPDYSVSGEAYHDVLRVCRSVRRQVSMVGGRWGRGVVHNGAWDMARSQGWWRQRSIDTRLNCLNGLDIACLQLDLTNFEQFPIPLYGAPECYVAPVIGQFCYRPNYRYSI
jgi:hypothetical protein